MNQGRRLERLARTLLAQLGGRDPAQLLVHHHEKVGSLRQLPHLERFQDSRRVIHVLRRLFGVIQATHVNRNPSSISSSRGNPSRFASRAAWTMVQRRGGLWVGI